MTTIQLFSDKKVTKEFLLGVKAKFAKFGKEDSMFKGYGYLLERNGQKYGGGGMFGKLWE